MKKSRLQQTSIEVAVGTFMFMVLLALGFFTIVLSRENILSRNYYLEVRFDSITGLTKGDKVYVRGVDVGRVKGMEIEGRNVLVNLTLKQRIILHEGYRISVQPSSMLGGRFILLEEGPAEAPVLPDEARLVGSIPVDFIQDASVVIQKFRQTLDEGGVLKNLETTMANIQEISSGLKNGEGTIGKLLKDESVYTEIKNVTANLSDITSKIKNGEGTLGKLVTEDRIYSELQSLLANLNEVSRRLADGEGTMGRLMSQDDTLYNDLAATAASLRDITTTISKGEGTLGKLAKDDQVYEKLNSLLQEVRALVDDIRETAPVTSFSSMILGGF